MRIPKFLAAAVLAVVAYVVAPAFTAPLINSAHPTASVVTGGVAFADQADDSCKDANNPSACTTGYRGYENHQDVGKTCLLYQGSALTDCQTGFNNAKAADPNNVAPTTPSSNSPPAAAGSDEKECDQGSLTWLFCPLVDGIAQFVTGTTEDLLSKFLSVEPLQFSGPIYDTWNGVRALANIAFVLIFIIMIFANTLRISAYSVRKILPRLVAAAVLVQLSFVISALIIDIGNVLGAGVSSIIGSITQSGGPANPSTGSVVESVVEGLGLGIVASMILIAWPFAVSAGLMLLIAVLAAISVITVRYFLLGMLIVLSPLAFIAWVLPGTEQYFDLWRKTLFKLVLMFPLIILILSVAGNTTALIPNMTQPQSSVGDAGQNIATSIVKILMLITAFAAIGGTFKWAGGFMEMAANQIGNLRGTGIKAVKNSQRYEEAKDKSKIRSAKRGDKIDHVLQKMIRGEGKFAKSSRGALLDAGGLILAGRGSTSPRAREMDAAQVINKKVKQIGEMRGGNDMMNWRRALLYHSGTTEQRLKAFTELKERKAEAILEHTGDLEGRQAIMRKLADKNLAGPEVADAISFAAQRNPKKNLDDLRMFNLENGKNIISSPALVARVEKTPGPTDTNNLGQPQQIGDVNHKAIPGLLASLTPDGIKDSDWKLDNYKEASNYKTAAHFADANSVEQNNISQQWAKAMFTNIPREAFVQTFNHADRRTFKGSDKRAETLIAFARHHSMITNPAHPAYDASAHDLYTAVMTQVTTNIDQHRDALRYIVREEDGAHILATLGLPHP
jgi:hypothetical protein